MTYQDFASYIRYKTGTTTTTFTDTQILMLANVYKDDMSMSSRS